MTKRALIIQPDYDLLAGFENSAACMAQVLRARCFEIIWCRASDANRAGILAAYDALIAGACGDDAIVIYYIGHGGLITNDSYDPEAPDLPRYIQSICPSDYAHTTEDDFRAISSYELSLRLAELTRRTANVTVLLDCCYATSMVRGAPPSNLILIAPKLTRVGLTKHLQALRAASDDFAALDPAGNPFAVRLSASGQTDAAYQLQLPAATELEALGLDLPAHGWIGAMTFRLAEVLAGVGTARVSWRAILSKLRSRLVIQRPELGGPETRVPFSLETCDAGMFSVRSEGATAIVDAGLFLGVAVGDVYGVMPGGAKTIDPAKLIAQLTIDEVTATEARGRRTGAGELPAGAVAIPISLALLRLPVRVVTDEARRPAVDTALRESHLLRAATERDRWVVGELRVRGDALELHDALGPLFPPVRYPDQLPAAVKDLENLATEQRLRALPDDRGPTAAGVTVTLVRIRDGQPHALRDHGEALGLRDRIALRLSNTGTTSVRVNVFNIGLRRRIARLTRDVSGLALLPAETCYVSNEVEGPLQGFELSWPPGLLPDQPRLDTMMVVVMPRPADLTLLVSSEHLGATRGDIARGVAHGVDAAPEAFAIRWLDYALYPIDASLDFGQPQVEASPPGSPPPRVNAARTRRMRLDQLTAATGTRIDVLVCARSADVPFRATTVLGKPSSELEVWRGELRGPADVYVWSSPLRADQRTLAELLALHNVAEPVAMLRANDGDPGARLAPGASLQLAAMARAALLGLAPDLATAFRGSFGADHAGAQRYAAAAVGFAIAITPS